MIATVLAGVAGILIAPVASLDPTSYTLFVVPALAAALVGRIQSFWITALAGLLIGCAQSEIEKLVSVFSWLPQQGLPDSLPFVVIIVVMAVRSRSVLARGGETAERNPSVGRPRPAADRRGLLRGRPDPAVRAQQRPALRVHLLADRHLHRPVGRGADRLRRPGLARPDVAGRHRRLHARAHLHPWGIGFPWSLILAGLCAVPVGLVIGLPALRLRGVNLAVVTLGFASAIDAVLFNGESFTGGTGGLPIPPPRLPGLNLAISRATPPTGWCSACSCSSS